MYGGKDFCGGDEEQFGLLRDFVSSAYLDQNHSQSIAVLIENEQLNRNRWLNLLM